MVSLLDCMNCSPALTAPSCNAHIARAKKLMSDLDMEVWQGVRCIYVEEPLAA
jgi:hypothetical protein